MANSAEEREPSPHKMKKQDTNLPDAFLDGETTEDTYLLPDQEPTSNPTSSLTKKLRSERGRRVLLAILFVVLLTSCGDQLKEAPETRIFESVICYKYYEQNDPSKLKLGRDAVGPGAIGGVDESDCRADSVQGQLAMLLGYQRLIDGFFYLVLAAPFGWAADRFGRWPFIFLNLLHYALRSAWTQVVTWNWTAFDIRTIWGASAFSLLGGGDPTASSLFFVAMADVTPADERAAAFLRAGAVNLSAYLFMPLLAVPLMEVSPWIPSLGGTALMLFATLAFWFVPETQDFHKQQQRQTPPTVETASTPLQNMDAADPPRSVLDKWFRTLRSSISFLMDDWRVPALVSTFTLHILMASIGRLLLQYLKVRYDLTFAKGTLIVSIRNGVIVVMLLGILPYLSKAMMRVFKLSGQRKDLYLARALQILIAAGWFFVAASPNLPTVIIALIITAMGHGAPLLVRSFLTSLLPANRLAQVYSILSITDTVGSMFGAPLLAGLFGRGLALGGGWIGIPFYFVGLVASFFAALLFIVRLRKGEDKTADDEVL